MLLIQVVIALGLLNVWLVRANLSTAYRGGGSRTLREEFQVYGLPRGAFELIGALKICSAVALLIGIWIPALVAPAAALVCCLMIGAVVMHAKVRDPLKKTVPAATLLLLSLLLSVSAAGVVTPL